MRRGSTRPGLTSESVEKPASGPVAETATLVSIVWDGTASTAAAKS